MTAPAWLLELGIPEDCISNSSSAREKGRRFSIRPRRGSNADRIWRIQVDGCWLPEDVKKVDYLFWGQSGSGRKLVVLVELKGQDFGKALQQIRSTLDFLCKGSVGNRVHTGVHGMSPGHDLPAARGIKAYVVLATARGVPQRQADRERIRKRYGVVVYHQKQRVEIDGLDAVP